MYRIHLITLIFLMSGTHFTMAVTQPTTLHFNGNPGINTGAQGGLNAGMPLLGAVLSYHETGDAQIALGSGAQTLGVELITANCNNPFSSPMCVIGFAVVGGGLALAKKGKDTKNEGEKYLGGGGGTNTGEDYTNNRLRSGTNEDLDNNGENSNNGNNPMDGGQSPRISPSQQPSTEDIIEACALYNYSCEIGSSGELKSITTPDNKTIHTPFERDDFVDAGLGEEYDAQSDQIEAYKDQINDYMTNQLNENQSSSLSDNNGISSDDVLLDNESYDDINISRDIISPSKSGRSFSDSDGGNFFKNFFKNDNKKKDRSIQSTQQKQVGSDKVGSADGNIFEQVSRSYANFKNI